MGAFNRVILLHEFNLWAAYKPWAGKRENYKERDRDIARESKGENGRENER